MSERSRSWAQAAHVAQIPLLTLYFSAHRTLHIFLLFTNYQTIVFVIEKWVLLCCPSRYGTSRLMQYSCLNFWVAGATDMYYKTCWWLVIYLEQQPKFVKTVGLWGSQSVFHIVTRTFIEWIYQKNSSVLWRSDMQRSCHTDWYKGWLCMLGMVMWMLGSKGCPNLGQNTHVYEAQCLSSHRVLQLFVPLLSPL